jgi:hypothetical protein
LVKDSGSMTGYAFLHSNLNKSFSIFWGGPYVFLPPGEYTATFRLRLEYPTTEPLIGLYVSSFLYTVEIGYSGTNSSGYHLNFQVSTNETTKVFAERTLNASDFNGSNNYKEFPVNFTVSEFGAYEFRGTALTNSSSIYFDNVKLTQTKPTANMTAQIIQNFPTK